MEDYFKICYTGVMEFHIFDHLPYRVYIRDIDHVIVYANSLVANFFGCPIETLIGQKYESIFKDESFIQHLYKVDEMLFSGDTTSLTTVKEFNRCYKNEHIFKVIDFIHTHATHKYIVTILVEIADTYCAQKGLDLQGIGSYDPANRLVRLHTGMTICLTRLENSFLFLLFEKKGDIATYDEIFIALDIYNKMDKTSLKSLVLRLKKKLNANIIKNVSMSGYKIISPE